MRDAELEKDSLHNLEVARHYFKLRKAYVAALQRCEEIIAAIRRSRGSMRCCSWPAQSSLNLAEGKGKQKSSLYVIHEGDTKNDSDAGRVSRVGARLLLAAREQLSRKQFPQPGRKCA